MYRMELTLVLSKARASDEKIFDTLSIDQIRGQNLTELMGQFLLVLANVHQKLMDECIRDFDMVDDDIPF